MEKHELQIHKNIWSLTGQNKTPLTVSQKELFSNIHIQIPKCYNTPLINGIVCRDFQFPRMKTKQNTTQITPKEL